ncbi:MAG: hypothetical protein NTX59_05050 [Elusimicrobia bacterium]|nr:hypothetical protein [Elusimicrobiota bacterium]
MKYIFLILALAVPFNAAAFNFDSFSKENLEFSSRVKENPVVVLQRIPLLEILAGRAASFKALDIEGNTFLAAVSFDDNWEVYFEVSLKGSAAMPSAWNETMLKDGVTFKYAGGELKIKEENGTIILTGPGGGSAQTSSSELFDLLYANSTQVTFGDAVTYAVARNMAPLSMNDGILTLRQGSDGLYYYSLTPDAQITGQPRWVLAINGVLYGLRLDGPELAFVSKAIEDGKSVPLIKAVEKVFHPGK